jgi:hypothetical protein
MNPPKINAPTVRCDFRQDSTPWGRYVPTRQFNLLTVERDGRAIYACACCQATGSWPGDRLLFVETVTSWSACPTCADLIDEGRRDDLLARALDRLLQHAHSDGEAVTDRGWRYGAYLGMSSVHGAFWCHHGA